MPPLLAWVAVAGLVGTPFPQSQPPPPTVADAATSPQGATTPAPGQNSTPEAIDLTIDAAEAEGETPARRLVSWNELDGKHLTFRFGMGYLYDVAAYAQDENSKEQITLTPGNKVRDFRLLFKGRLKFFERPVTYTMGLMYDGANDEWVARQTGLMIEISEAAGRVFIGRTKEGFSLNKVMVGYYGWTMERATMNDAALPILADGIKWLGDHKRFNWSLGFYGDWLSEGQSFSSYEHQIAGRFAWMPLLPEASDPSGDLLHVGLSTRYGWPKDETLRLRSRPEANPAPYFVDTGEFATTGTTMLGPEIYYRPGPWLFGSEYVFQMVDAPASGNPFFHGGDVFVAWMATGETRPYNAKGGYFNTISPFHPVFDGGWGAWEIVVRLSYIDLDGGTLTGGRFWRFTPMVNWYLTDYVRLEFNYGYGALDRFDVVGRTSFFQSRLQLQF